MQVCGSARTPVRLKDLFFEFKENSEGTVQPFMSIRRQINQPGLYVELDPYDAHIFIVEAQGAMETTRKLLGSTRQAIDEWR